MRHIVQAILVALAMAAGVLAAQGCAKADPGKPECETIPWGFMFSQRRTICDGPVLKDGSWNRGRVIWIPAHQVPITCSGSRYFTSCSGGYFVDMQVVSNEHYPVNPDTVLSDEPGHLGFLVT